MAQRIDLMVGASVIGRGYDDRTAYTDLMLVCTRRSFSLLLNHRENGFQERDGLGDVSASD